MVCLPIAWTSSVKKVAVANRYLLIYMCVMKVVTLVLVMTL
ncbi:LasU family protein [Psychrobacter sp. JCM 18900]